MPALPPSLGRKLGSRDTVLQFMLAVITVLLVMGPLAPILYQAVIDKPIYELDPAFTLGNFRRLFGDRNIGNVVWNTLIYGFLATLFAQIFGFVGAILIARTDVPGRSVFAEILLWPLYISSIVLAVGWITAYGPSGVVTLYAQEYLGSAGWNLYSITGLSLVTAVSHAPLTFLYCIASARLQDPALEDAARIAGARPLRILFSVNLPLLMPALIFSATMNFIITIESLALPLIIGGPVGLDFFTTMLYERGLEQATKDYGMVGAAAVILLLFVTGLLMLQNRLLRRSERYVTVGGKATRPRTFKLGKLRWPMFAVLSLYVIIAIGPVVIGVTIRAFTSILSPYVPISEVLTLDNFRTVFSLDVYRRSITNTLQIAVIGGLVGTVFITAISLVIQRSQFRFRKQLEFVALFPRAVPGIIVGIGAFYAVALIPIMGHLRNTIWILMLVFIMRYIPTGYGTLAPSLLQISKDLDRSARTVGADWTTTSSRIVLPLIKPAMLTCFAVLFVHFLKEYASAVFLFAPGTEVLGTTMLTFWNQGEVGPVSALALLQIALTASIILIARLLLKVKIYG